MVGQRRRSSAQPHAECPSALADAARTVEGAMAEARVEAEMAAAVMVVVKEEATCGGEQGHEKAAPEHTHGSCSAPKERKRA